jgi:hypothetical protein
LRLSSDFGEQYYVIRRSHGQDGGARDLVSAWSGNTHCSAWREGWKGWAQHPGSIIPFDFCIGSTSSMAILASYGLIVSIVAVTTIASRGTFYELSPQSRAAIVIGVSSSWNRALQTLHMVLEARWLLE